MEKISIVEIGWVAAIWCIILAAQVAITAAFYWTGIPISDASYIQVFILQAIIAGLVVEVWIKKRK